MSSHYSRIDRIMDRTHDQIDGNSNPQADTKIFFSGDDYYSACLEKIKNAQKLVVIESYIFECDETGFEFLSSLELCAQRGVAVTITVDGVGSINSITQLKYECLKRQINFSVYHPVLSHLKWLNRRNHRKFINIDGHTIFLGSFNISDLHCFSKVKGRAWRDTGLQITYKDKYYDSIIKSDIPLIHTNWNILQRFIMIRRLLRRIKKAKNKINITNPYFLPRPSIIIALIKAAKRGVQVTLLLPAISDVWFVRYASRTIYEKLIKSGVQIFEFQSSVLHAKTIRIDNIATIGSMNLNHRSLLHDLEIEAQLMKTEDLQTLDQQWERDLTNSKIISYNEIQSRSWMQKILGHFFYWFRYWL